MTRATFRVSAFFPELPTPVAEQVQTVNANNPGLAVNRAFAFMRDGKIKGRRISNATFYVVRLDRAKNGGAQ